MHFVHLHVHSYYSFLDGLARISDLISAAQSMGQPAIAITDHGYLYGLIPFYQAALNAGIKPILGCEFYFHPISRFEKSLGSKEQERHHHLTVLAANNTGYKNLIKLATVAATEGFYYKPRIDDEVLYQYRDGLIVLSGCPQGYIPSLILDDKLNEAREQIAKYKAWFGDNFYLEIQNHPILGAAADEAFAREYDDFAPREAKIRTILTKLSREMKVPLVATNDVHYVKPEDFRLHDVFYAMQLHEKLSNPDRRRYPADTFYLASGEEMALRFSQHEYPGALNNTLEIAEKCNVTIDALNDAKAGRYHFPSVYAPDGDVNLYLDTLVQSGIIERGLLTSDKLDQYYDRLDYEMSVIKKMNFAPFFIVMSDVVKWAKAQGIPVGPGRGSAAGSLVSYLLGITDIDPIQHGLLFERFLNPDRVSMPDIDVDYCQDRRDEVIQYARKKYGEDRVAHIVTINVMKLRGAIQKVGMVIDIDPKAVDEFTKRIPPDIETREQLFEAVPEAKAVYDKDPKIRQCVDLALNFIGMPSNAGVHAAGVVIADQPLSEYIACKLEDGVLVTQADMGQIESLGLLKMDFLGLRTLTMLRHTADMVKTRYGVDIDFSQLPLDDPLAYKLYHDDCLEGVFQVESNIMRQLIRDIKPRTIYDLALVIALCRPGPLDAKMPGSDRTLAQEYVERRRQAERGVTRFTYPHPLAERALKDTLGIMVYQEQIMQLAVDMAGYTKGESDQLRKIIGKKLVDKMPEQREKFVNGCVARGVSRDVAEVVFEQIEAFGRYAFNYSHSLSYAFISYYTAYMKAHYPAEFMAALLTSVQGDQDKTNLYLAHCQKLGIRVLLPDVTQSGVTYTVTDDGSIMMGLSAIKYVSTAATEHIISVRNSAPFRDIADFIQRTDNRLVNRRVIDALMRVGALDTFGPRHQLITGLDEYLSAAKRIQGRIQRLKKKLSSESVDDIAVAAAKIEQAEDELRALPYPMHQEALLIPTSQIRAWEQELLGYVLTTTVELDLSTRGVPTSIFMPIKDIVALADGARFVTCVLFENAVVFPAKATKEVKRKDSKSNKGVVAHIYARDSTGSIKFNWSADREAKYPITSLLKSSIGPHVVIGMVWKKGDVASYYAHAVLLYPTDLSAWDRPDGMLMVNLIDKYVDSIASDLIFTLSKLPRGEHPVIAHIMTADGVIIAYLNIQLPFTQQPALRYVDFVGASLGV